MTIHKTFNIWKRPKKIIIYLAELGAFNWMPDEAYLQMMYKCHMGQKLDLSNPITYNQKLQWLKLHDRRPEYRIYADKYAVREFLKQTVGEEYLIPTIGVYNNVEEIPWEELPNQFVLKCTHASGTNIICHDKNKLDIEKSKQQLKKWMNMDFFWQGREWQYKNMHPKIICEQFMVDESGYELKDYKFHCFNGEPKCLNVILNRYSGLNANFYDLEWNPLPFYQHYAPSKAEVAKPKSFDKMVEFAKKFSQGLPYIRVDYYEVNGHLYIGELTLHPASGWLEFAPESADELLGSWIELPR